MKCLYMYTHTTDEGLWMALLKYLSTHPAIWILSLNATGFEKERERQRDRETERQTDGQIDRQS